MYLIRQMVGSSQDDIGKFFGRDRSTVIYALTAIEKALRAKGNDMEDKLRDITGNIEANA